VVAAIVLEAGSDGVDTEALETHCAQALARYKVPTRYVVVSDLPRNPNTGKVQRREVADRLAELLTP